METLFFRYGTVWFAKTAIVKVEQNESVTGLDVYLVNDSRPSVTISYEDAHSVEQLLEWLNSQATDIYLTPATGQDQPDTPPRPALVKTTDRERPRPRHSRKTKA